MLVPQVNPAGHGERERRFGGLLRQRGFRLLWTGETISRAGSAAAVVATPLLALFSLHASAFMVSALAALAYLPWLLIGLPAGVLADRLDPRRLMMTCDIASAAAYASLPAAAWLHMLTLAQVMVTVFLAGVANVLFTTAYQVYLPSVVRPDELVEGNAKLQASASAASIGGPGLVGLTAGPLGAALALLLNAASFIVSAICLAAIRAQRSHPGPKAHSEGTGRVVREIAEGVGIVARDRYLRPLTIWAALVNLAMSGYSAIIVVFLVRTAGLGPGPAGALLAASGFGGVTGALATGQIIRRYGTARGLLVTAFAGMPFSLLIPLAGPGWRLAFFPLGAMIAFSSMTAATVILSSFRQAYCPPDMLGRVVATMRFLLYGASPIGALLGGILATWLGTRNALWITLTATVLSGLLLTARTFREDRDLPQACVPHHLNFPV
jgi:predicted MFS family arabinose efflux permease